ncbi:MAG: adenylate/guanylate cyclase domain-containing protein [Reyranellaceae bacterium]
MTEQRRLAAILVADVVGYSRLVGQDESGTLTRLAALRRDVIDPTIARHAGRLFKAVGDGFLVEFASAVQAVAAARAIQDANASGTLPLRIGIHVGDVVVEGDDLMGDGVNIAARIEGVADVGGIAISRQVYDQVRDRLDVSFVDKGEVSLKNLARPVQVFMLSGAAPSSAAEPATALSLPDKPSIAVMPFQNMSGDPEQEYFADGMSEELITALSRIRWLFVVARQSSFTFKGQNVDAKRIGQELGVRYVLEGSVRKAGGRVRITTQLIDAETGSNLWADRFDGQLEDVFDLQDSVASRIVGVIEPTLQAAESYRSDRRRMHDLNAYDLYLQAYSKFLSPTRDVPGVIALLDEVVARDPDFGPALAWAAVCHFLCDFNSWCTDLEENRRVGVSRGRRALLVAADDPTILANSALALGYFGEDIEAMMALADRALALNPNFARGWHVSGLLRLWSGQPDVAIDHVETSMRLSPRARVGWGLAVIGWAHVAAGRFEQGASKLQLAMQEDRIPSFYLGLAACCAQLGRLHEARDILEARPAGAPTSFTSTFAHSWRNVEQRGRLLTGLRLAVDQLGVPE